MEKRLALGKGLSALIPDAPDIPRSAPIDADIDRLAPNDFQPRLDVNDARLQELAQSIKSNGVIQPIVVRRIGDRLQIIGGAALAGGEARRAVARADRDPRCRAGSGEIAPRDGPRREHSARGSESDRR